MKTALLAAGALAAAALFAESPASAQSLVFTPGPGAGGGAPLAYDGPDAVHVHIEGNGTLFEESTNGWQPVCFIPCTTTVSPRGNFKLGGMLMKDSDSFQFPAGRPLELTAHTASSLDFGSSIVGWTLVGLAPAPIMMGTLVFTGTFDEPGGSPSTLDRVLGGAIAAAGLALLAFGIYELVDTPKTSITTSDGVRLARAPSLRLGKGVTVGMNGMTF